MLAPARGIVGPPARYELGDVLAVGGMGTLHRAFDTVAGRPVAYKRLLVSSEADRARLTPLFQREYDTLVRLAHPNIVAAFDYGLDQEGPYYTMELLDGDDLSKLIPTDWREASRWLRDVASALALVHARRLIHRDLSPNNVRISSARVVKLLDFGGLMAMGPPTEVVGTPGFLAPECLTGEALDQRADLYGLGALAYWTLTRHHALRARTLPELHAAWDRPIPPPSHYVPQMPRELDELVLALLQRDKLMRPPSAPDVIERLTTLADLEPEQHEARVAFSYLDHVPLSGREPALAQWRTALRRVGAGRGSVLVIEGARGSGRSAALEQIGVEAQLAGASLLRADARVLDGPFGLMSQLAQNSGGYHMSLRSAFDDVRVTVRPGAERAGAPRTAVEGAERHALAAETMQRGLLQVAERGPVVVSIDNADSADEQSLSVLAAMSRLLHEHPIVVVLARLNTPASSDALAVLSARAVRVGLSTLSEDEVRELARNVFGEVPNLRRITSWLSQESGGLPALCVELIRMLLSRGDIRYTRGTFVLAAEYEAGLSRSLSSRAAVQGVAALHGTARTVASLLSSSEFAMTLEQLASAANLHTVETFCALEELAEQRLIVEASGKFALESLAVRRHLEAAQSSEETCALHLALARTLERGKERTTLERYAAGLHYIRAGGQHELTGAAHILEAARGRNYDVALAAVSVPYLEASLAVYRRHGYEDREVVDLLVRLTLSGFYGNIAAQRRHFDATMAALYSLTGLGVSRRLSRWIGARLSLMVGILCACAWSLLRPRRLARRSPLTYIESILNVASTATASAASVLDRDDAERCVAWLAPFAAASKRSPMHIAGQFCTAVAELPAGELVVANQRLEPVLRALQAPVRGMNDLVREQMRSGCLNGLAQCTIETRPARALEAADRLARDGAFFAPHAELVRAIYHGHRGELAQYERRRSRTEALAMSGGVSWSALTLLAVRDHQIALLTDNTNALVHCSAALQRIAPLSSKLALLSQLAEADLLLLRGRVADAARRYAILLDSLSARDSAFVLMGYAMYGRALREMGEHERARELCTDRLASYEDGGPTQGLYGRRCLIAQLALAEAELGSFASAQARLEEQVALAGSDGNPLVLGSLRRDLAHVAVLMGEPTAFAVHFAEMKRAFDRTENPWLLQQCDALLALAGRRGLGTMAADTLPFPQDSEPQDIAGTTALSFEP